MTGAGAAAVTAVLAVGVTGALASVHGHTRDNGQCTLYQPRCGTPLVDRPTGPQMALQATAVHRGAPVVIEERDLQQGLQDWTYTILGSVPSLARQRGNGLGLTAYDARTFESAWVVRLELTPGGKKSRLCAADVNNMLVLAGCGKSSATFIQTKTVNGIRAIIGYFGLSTEQSPHVLGHHMAATGSYLKGTQVSFNTPASIDLQYWFEARVPRPRPRRTCLTACVP